MDPFEIIKLASALVALGSAVVLLYAQVNKAKKELSDTKKELSVATEKIAKLQDRVLSSDYDTNTSKLNLIHSIIYNAAKDSIVDRVVVFRAVNKKNPIGHVSAVAEYHKDHAYLTLSMGAAIKYFDIPSDSYYQTMLSEITRTGDPWFIVTENMITSDLKGFYEDEKVTSSVVCFGVRKPIDEENDCILYVSWASHDKKKLISKSEQLRLNGVTKQMKDLL